MVEPLGLAVVAYAGSDDLIMVVHGQSVRAPVRDQPPEVSPHAVSPEERSGRVVVRPGRRDDEIAARVHRLNLGGQTTLDAQIEDHSVFPNDQPVAAPALVANARYEPGVIDRVGGTEVLRVALVEAAEVSHRPVFPQEGVTDL